MERNRRSVELNDKERMDGLEKDIRELRYSLIEVKQAQRYEEPPPLPAVVFDCFCLNCQKDTRHVSTIAGSINKQRVFVASTSMNFVAAPPLLRICLVCGKETYKEIK